MICAAALGFSCRDYLEIVPDNVLTLDEIYSNREQALYALAKTYSYLPRIENVWNSEWVLGDDLICDIGDNSFANINIMKGLQSPSNVLLGYWQGSGGATNLYQGIDICNIFIDNIDKALDMSVTEKSEWKAQVKFLKAWYHFVLLQHYGPIVIADKHIPPNAGNADLFPSRSKVNECFDYIIRLMDETIPELKERYDGSEFGRIDRIAAIAAKARVMLFRASPFYNNSREIFGDFFDRDNQPFFTTDSESERKNKWKEALDAIDAAITFSETNGKGLYTYEKTPYLFDMENFEANGQNMKTFYNLRMIFVDQVNKELLWGYTNIDIFNARDLQTASLIRCPVQYNPSVVESASGSYNWLSAPYRVAERFYTVNGLPLDDDLTFNRLTMHQVVTLPGVDEPEYTPMQGIMQPGGEVIRLYMNREPRFYTNLIINGGYVRAHTNLIAAKMLAGTDVGYRSALPRNYFFTGIGVQKFIYPTSTSGSWQVQVRYPYPMIRMADLYLMKAEAMNEYLDAPTQDVYDAINKVRQRAGIPNVEDAWHNAAVVRPASLDKHLTKDGMRDIILHERSVELAFEGSRYWDMKRHTRAHLEFNSPIFGWSGLETFSSDFFILETKEERKFSVRDYLMPISLNEININANLIQNPGW
jgi:hypothetical protein